MNSTHKTINEIKRQILSAYDITRDLSHKMLYRHEPLLNGYLEKYFKRYIGAILCLHRVDRIDPNRLWMNEELKVSPLYLEHLIIEYLKHHIDVVSLDEALIRTVEGTGKPFVCFTFDDGYKDNYLNAYPIFKKYNLPFCINLATSFPEKTAILFWDILEEIILNNSTITLNDGTVYNCNTKELKESAFVSIREKIFKLPVSSFGNSLMEMLSNYKFDLYEPARKQALDWSEIIKMKESGLCTFGNHTHSHLSILDTPVEEMIKDIRLCNESYRKNVGDELRYFCFPYGRFDENKQNTILEQFAFSGLLTLNRKYIDRDTKANCLPRFIIEEKRL